MLILGDDVRAQSGHLTASHGTSPLECPDGSAALLVCSYILVAAVGVP